MQWVNKLEKQRGNQERKSRHMQHWTRHRTKTKRKQKKQNKKTHNTT
jgi:hypothetical protein